MTEETRKRVFDNFPVLASFLAIALQDLQFAESDEACGQGREARDIDTIYDCPDETFMFARAYCNRFVAAMAGTTIAAGKSLIGPERMGSTLYLAAVGHGVSFTDDGNAPCLVEMEDWARENRIEGLYLGDDGRAYFG